MKWDVTLNNIVQRIAEENNISPEEVKRMVEYTMKKTQDCMELPEMPKVLLRYLGTFRVTSYRLTQRIEDLNKYYKEGRITEEEYLEKKEYFESILNRRISENGKKVYKR